MEQRLYQYSVQIGITKFSYCVEDPDELHKLFPHATIFIGADGTGSIMVCLKVNLNFQKVVNASDLDLILAERTPVWRHRFHADIALSCLL